MNKLVTWKAKQVVGPLREMRRTAVTLTPELLAPLLVVAVVI